MSNPLQKFFVDASGAYLGSRVGYMDKRTKQPVHGPVPDGWIEVPTPPDHRLQKWTGSGWDSTPPPPRVKTHTERIDDFEKRIELLEAKLAALEAKGAR